MMKLNKEEQEIEALFELDQISLSNPSKKLLSNLRSAADSPFRKDRRIKIRLSERDMVGIQRVAAAKVAPCQSLISGLIHQYVEGDLVHKSENANSAMLRMAARIMSPARRDSPAFGKSPLSCSACDRAQFFNSVLV